MRALSKSSMRALYRGLLLPFEKKRFLGRSLAIVIMIRLGLWLLPFNIVRNRLVCAQRPDGNEIDWGVVRRVVRSVELCGRFVPFASCLTLALATQVLMRMEGQYCDLKIGVAKNPDRHFGAHAWVEIGGQIVIGKLPQHHHFTVLG